WRTGVGRLTVELVAAMAAMRPKHRFLVLTTPDVPSLPCAADNVEQRPVDCGIASISQAVRYGARTAHLGIDVFFFTHPLAAPIFDAAPSVGLILDVYPLLFSADYA